MVTIEYRTRVDGNHNWEDWKPLPVELSYPGYEFIPRYFQFRLARINNPPAFIFEIGSVNA